MLFAWKYSVAHAKFYAYQGPAIQKSSKMKLFIKLVSALKTCCCYNWIQERKGSISRSNFGRQLTAKRFSNMSFSCFSGKWFNT